MTLEGRLQNDRQPPVSHEGSKKTVGPHNLVTSTITNTHKDETDGRLQMADSELLRISVVIPTKDRSNDLADLMKTILDQTRIPFQTIIVDGSQGRSAKQVTFSFREKFESRGCELVYVSGGFDGLTAARNLGVEFCKGDAILFLDDDTLLERDVILDLSRFLTGNVAASGVEPSITIDKILLANKLASGKVWNILAKILMLSYSERNRCGVRRSMESVLPSSLTRPILAQRLRGVVCYRASVFKKHTFDTNLKRWAYGEDLDFSYRVQRSNPNSLYAIPSAKVLHRTSSESRMRSDLEIQMRTIYRFYVFFKTRSHESLCNTPAFLLAQLGHLIEAILRSAIERDAWGLIFFLRSLILALRNLRDILKRELEFFNSKVN
jgi:GT2 family glycosyltransferase